MSKRSPLWLILALLPILLFASGCNDSNADATADASELTKSAADKCGGCPDAEICQSQGTTATVACDPATHADAGQAKVACDPSKCTDAQRAKCAEAGHSDKCVGGEKCTPADCSKCPEKGNCSQAKSETAASKPAGCPSGKKCGGH